MQAALATSLATINGFDLFALIVLCICMLASLWRGVIAEVASLAGWVIAFLIARFYGEDIAAILFKPIEPTFIRIAVAWVATFVVVLLVANLCGTMAKRLLQAGGLSGMDRLGGALFGLVKGALVLVVLVWVGGYTPVTATELWKNSKAASGAAVVIDLVKQNHAWTAEPTAPTTPATPIKKPIKAPA
jgi:membrane protein required for colicin V production